MANNDININTSFTLENNEKIKQAFVNINNYCKPIPLRKRVILEVKYLLRKTIHRKRNKRLAAMISADALYRIYKEMH